MTLQELLQYGKNQLQEADILESEIDAWYLLEYIINIDRAHYLLNPNKKVEEEQRIHYMDCIRRRKIHIPLQYITGVQEFMGLPFHVNESVLIPRQDTEILVETVIPYVKDDMSVLDMCTGSGCILISLLHHLKEKTDMKIQGTGVDISNDALMTAKRNAEKLKADCQFIQSDLFDKVGEKYDIIVSNPPYIPTKVVEELMPEVKKFEPMIALDGDEDGLFFYKKIVSQSQYYLRGQGSLFFEIGHDQGDAVSMLMEQAGYFQIRVIKDLAGLDRVVCGKIE
ncbi:peptide chain release factor N(5)-glutamine methyltransferase [Anaerosacchariphilus polymeriproducens]|uniref:Release factor glutamine methyltransferase n=1 Tax=Anaerosacchariphilus polymeriproducens TaxID=1812858 RepID=A0A371AV06_9FIRM|nr:peptide chain release factor N(5)-glutamine methyltransferase [Anaerosacchariphilus polymeriproducens]RDU23408.1 peptide chain release factor N(5)-glutamine methyltransferase [Anaerosacchariphilus polymeriproducens]